MGTTNMFPTLPTNTGQTGFPSIDSLAKVGVWKREFDYAVATTVKGTAIADGDIYAVGILPYQTGVLAGQAQVLTAVNGSTSTVSFGITTLGGAAFVSTAAATTAGLLTQAAYTVMYFVPSGGKTVIVTVPTAGGAVTGLLLLNLVIADLTTANAFNQKL